MTEDYGGCSSICRRKGSHTLRRWECAFALPPPCEHPSEAICWDSDASGIVCGECRGEVSIRMLAEGARAGLSTGCTCYGDECSGRCKPRAMAWNLDPAKVLRILELMGM